MQADPHVRRTHLLRFGAAAVATIALTFGVAACGDDDDEGDTSAAATTETTTEAASADTVSVTTANDGDGFSWDVEPTPTAETKSVEFTNDSDEFHVLVFARLGEDVTLDEALKAEGEKGTATEVTKGAEAPPGETVTAEVTEDLTPGEYVLLCPLGGPEGAHVDLGQLEEFSIE